VGKPIATKRLFEESFIGMTPADRALVAALQVQTTIEGGYPVAFHSWRPELVWPALVNHPAVFDEAGKPLTIVEAEARLVVEHTKDHVKVQLAPQTNGQQVAVTKVGNGYEFILFSQQQRVVAEALSGGLTAPVSEKGRLEQLLERVQCFKIVMKHDDAEAVCQPANPQVVALLTPKGQGLSMELKCQPTNEDEPRCNPGVGAALVLGKIDGKSVRFQRDLDAERANLDHLFDLPAFANPSMVNSSSPVSSIASS